MSLILQPKHTKFRKVYKGCNRGLTQDTDVSFSTLGLKAAGHGHLTVRQVEAVRCAITCTIKRQGRIWIRVFPDKPITEKPLEVRMGKGKGDAKYWVALIQPGKALYKMGGVPEELTRETSGLTAVRLSIKTAFITKTVM